MGTLTCSRIFWSGLFERFKGFAARYLPSVISGTRTYKTHPHCADSIQAQICQHVSGAEHFSLGLKSHRLVSAFAAGEEIGQCLFANCRVGGREMKDEDRGPGFKMPFQLFPTFQALFTKNAQDFLMGG